MGYTILYHPTTQALEKMLHLSCLFYEEAHNEKPTDAVADMTEQTIVVNGNFTECYSFRQLIGG